MKTGLQAVFQTRYSFFGSSGWQSRSSKEKETLLDPERLKKRFALFEKMNLASLRDQSDPDFKLLILTSADLPDDHARLLTEACNDTLGEDRVRILYRAPGSAGRWLQKYVSRRLRLVSHTLQIVLDDDDAVSNDFVEMIKREGEFGMTTLKDDNDCMYLSVASGLTAKFGRGGIDLMKREVAFTNLGLTLLAHTKSPKSPYMLAHKKVARRHTVRVIYDQRPYYIRAVHDTNDSRTHHADVNMTADQVEPVLPYFPLLRDLRLNALAPDQPLTDDAAVQDTSQPLAAN